MGDMLRVEEGTPSEYYKKINISKYEKQEFPHGYNYELVIRDYRYKREGRHDPIALLTEKLYQAILDIGGTYPHYLYAKYQKIGETVNEQPIEEWIIWEMRIQFYFASPQIDWAFWAVVIAGILESVALIVIAASAILFILVAKEEWDKFTEQFPELVPIVVTGGIIAVILIAIIILILLTGIGRKRG